MSREQEIKAGKVERLMWPGRTLSLYWEVWAEVKPMRATFIVEMEVGNWARDYKAAFDTLEEADADFKKQTDRYATEIAMVAMGITGKGAKK